MTANSQLLFFFSALGAFNGVLLGIYFFFFNKPKSISNFFLGGLLVAMSIRIWKSVFFYFNPELSKLFLQIGLSACFFIGPFLFFYILSKLKNSKVSLNAAGITLNSLLLITLAVGYTYPYSEFPVLWKKPLIKAIYYQWMFFVIASGVLMIPVIKKLFSIGTKLTYEEIFMLNVYVGSFIVWAAFFFSAYTSYIVGALSFSFVLYLSLVVIYYHRKSRFKTVEKREKYSNKIDENEAKELISKMEQKLKSEKLFTDPNLTLPVFASQLNMKPHLVSQLLNDNLNKSFTNYINEYRIDEAKKLLKEHSNLKIEAIAENCGFNSNSTFYSAFKKFTDTTPARFIDNS